MKHINVNAPVAPPTVVEEILTGELSIRFEGKKPKVKLTQLSNGMHEVSYVACGAIHGRRFDKLRQAESYFQVLTGAAVPGRREVA
jgi:hypothetical protein